MSVADLTLMQIDSKDNVTGGGVEHVEDLSAAKGDLAGDGPRSAFEDLPTFKAIVTFKRLFLSGVVSSLGAMYIGYTGSAIGAIIANVGFIDQFGTVRSADGTLALDAQYIAIWGGVQSAATVGGVLISPLILDRLGRKALMYTLTTMVIIAIILELVAKDWKVFTAAKVFAGLGSGSLGPSIMTYMSEISMSQFRGVLLSVFALSFALGQFTNAIGTQIVNITHPDDYRRVFYSEFAIVAVWLAACVYLPESPVWLITKGREDKAKRSLHRLVGDVPGFDLDHEFLCLVTDVHRSEAFTKSHASSDWQALFQWRNFKRCIASSIPFAGQCFAGVPYIYGYTTYFFQTAGLKDPFLGNTILNVIAICSISASFVLVDKIGRRPLVLTGLGVLAVLNTLIGGLGFITDVTTSSGSALTALCSLWIFVYSLTLAPLGWVGTVDISSVRLRAKTATFGTFVNASINLVFSYTVPLLLSDQDAGWGQKIGLLFAGFSLLTMIPAFFLYPETKGRTYTEIDELYESGIPVRKFAQAKTSVQMLDPDVVDASVQP